jgi:hypothetical protein
MLQFSSVSVLGLLFSFGPYLEHPTTAPEWWRRKTALHPKTHIRRTQKRKNKVADITEMGEQVNWANGLRGSSVQYEIEEEGLLELFLSKN